MALIFSSSDILSHFSQKVDQKLKMVESEVGLNFALNDSEWALLVISSDICPISAQFKRLLKT